jgi:hypothetical protein
MSGTKQYPAFYLPLGKAWNILFLNLTNWLPQLKDIELADQDSVMIQYKADNAWKPLAGDEQLEGLLEEFNISGRDLHVRCAPESEFRSSSGESEGDDDGDDILHIYKGHRGSASTNREEKKLVSHAATTLLSCCLGY